MLLKINENVYFSVEGMKYYNNASIDHAVEFSEVQSRMNFSMHGYEDVPWEHLTPEECKM